MRKTRSSDTRGYFLDLIGCFVLAFFAFVVAIEVSQHLSREWQTVFWLLVLGGLVAHFKLTMK